MTFRSKIVCLSLFCLFCFKNDVTGQSQVIFSSSKGSLNSGGTLGLKIYDQDSKYHKTLLEGSVRQRGEYNASVSPDGSRILFNTYRFGGWKLAVGDFSNGQVENIKKLTGDNHYQYNARYSPDGSRIAYQEFNWNSRETHIIIVNPEGKEKKRLGQMALSDQAMDWTRDGRGIVYVSVDKDFYNIFSITLDGSTPKNITKGKRHCFAVSTSKQEDKMAYLATSEGKVSLFVSDMDGSNELNITPDLQTGTFENDGFWAYRTCWSPDGKQITFNVMVGGNHEIFTVKVDGKGLTRLTNNKDTDITPFWAN